jgi:hypothetical protein
MHWVALTLDDGSIESLAAWLESLPEDVQVALLCQRGSNMKDDANPIFAEPNTSRRHFIAAAGAVIGRFSVTRSWALNPSMIEGERR